MSKRYTPDFPEMMRICETNFAQLRRLIPRVDEVGENVAYQVNGGSYRLTIIESTRYTSVVEIMQTEPAVSHWSLPSMVVRLYHDAQVAEVCASQQIYRFKASYDYPNKKLHQRDEKHQINQFLADWLRYCLAHGAVAVPVC
ncbi:MULTISPECIES: DUF1249 family protein [Yersinia]|jgi:uncharacterized protein|uniref:DUF1249 family protein n=1 Tax=Yersinia intermedia TaxID=631 RepID=A0A0T9MGW0_YERIN|nr:MULTISPECIES: DUF1249 family protein [Yersinia]AJJ21098.1 hypothetical protein CH53_2345 [Yersinia intermedia]ARB82673.1 hypothetical protein A6J67_00175 [Yersinia sp. FDAARGOS_228]AVL36403.1 hypothetical protein CEQ36_12850 [Yersinia intermedia]EEQ18604.1 hypothetical protein yinte0001_2780 [Yersinia intermedia ATCC 29909]MCB5298266.1 DUF1249 family protein [Yersinia intermedia]